MRGKRRDDRLRDEFDKKGHIGLCPLCLGMAKLLTTDDGRGNDVLSCFRCAEEDRDAERKRKNRGNT